MILRSQTQPRWRASHPSLSYRLEKNTTPNQNQAKSSSFQGNWDQFFQVMQAMSLFIKETFSSDSDFSSKFEFLYEDFLDIRKALKSKFSTHGKDFGRYIYLLVHNVVGQFVRDMKKGICPFDRHINLHSLIEQIQIGATITIPNSKPIDWHNKDDQRNNRHNYNDRQNNRYQNNQTNDNNRDRWQPRSGNRDDLRQPHGGGPRQKGKYEFKEGKNYGSFFNGDRIRRMTPQIPAARDGKRLCLKHLFNGSCNQDRYNSFHGNTRNMDAQIKAWIDGNHFPVKKRES